MHGILVICKRDWLEGRGSSESVYVHEVFRRVAAVGHYVAMLSAEPSLSAFVRAKGAASQVVDGIHLARLGIGPLYHRMLGMFFARAAKGSSLLTKFDVVVDCITKQPFPLADHVDIPALPLVFGLSKRFRSDGDPPGPVLAATEEAADALGHAGLPERFVVRMPAGTDAATWDARAGLVMATIDNMLALRDKSVPDQPPGEEA